MSTLVNINGKILKPQEAFINVFDRAVLYGDGVYETLRTYNGKIFLYEQHYKRLKASLDKLFIKINFTAEQIYYEIIRTIQATFNKESMIRLIITRGLSPINLNPDYSDNPTLIIIVQEYQPFPKEYYEKGVNLIISKVRRNPIQCLDPSIKSLNLLNNFLAYKEAIEKKAFDAILLNIKGYVAEGTTFNIFWVKDNIIFTPSEKVGILLGITRDLIINIARKLGLKLKKGFYKAEALLNSDECFITSTLKEILPAQYINDKKIGRTCPGEITVKLMNAFKEELSLIMNNRVSY